MTSSSMPASNATACAVRPARTWKPPSLAGEKQAEDRISQAETQAVREVRGEIVDVAIAAARRLIAERLDESRQAALLDAAIDDLPARLH